MTSVATAAAIGGPFGDIGARFMLSGRTYERGAQLGYPGMTFYFAGRSGVLGDVDADTVVDEFGFFWPEAVTGNWLGDEAPLSPEEVATEFLACGYGWAHAKLPNDLDAARLAELVHRVTDAAVARGDQPALFTAWASLDWPEDPTEAALHAIHLMRELRGGLHVVATRAEGLHPRDAVLVKGGPGVIIMGWPEPHPDPEPHRDAWRRAEALTDELVAANLEVLDESEQAELVALANACVPER